MKIQVNTDHNIHAHEAFLQEIEATVESALGHLAEHVTRVEVHVTDVNAQKHGRADKRCLMEARLEKHQPIAVTEESANVEEAVEGAAQKLKRLLEHTVGRLGEHMT